MITLIVLISILLFVSKIIDSAAIPTFIVFLVLKLCGVIAWSWVLVCLPLIVLVGSIILGVILSVISAFFEKD